MTTFLTAGLATGVGSLPHTDPTDAAAFVLERLPELPAVPSLPARSPLEGMLAQAAWGMAGVTVAPDGTLDVVPAQLDAEVPFGARDPDTNLDDEPYVALRAFLELAAARPHRGPVKLQLTGPVTLGAALLHAGAPGPRAFGAAGTAVRQQVRALVDRVAARLPHAPLLLVLDEPGFGLVGDGGLPLSPNAAADLVAHALDAAGPGVVSGVHCCAEAEWASLLRAGVTVLSLPVERAGRLRPGDVRPFLEDGGWLAWGAVPTTGPVGGATHILWSRLAERWHDLVAGGCDPVLVRTRALVTPACGLTHHTVAQAAAVVHLVVELGARIAEGALSAPR